MMRTLLLLLILAAQITLQAQTTAPQGLEMTGMLAGLRVGDSLTYYQCHVEEAVQQLSTASGQTLTGKARKYSITEKYVLHRTDTGYVVHYYTSSLNVFPNKKFSTLKIREKPYWDFKRESSAGLNEQDLRVLMALEKKGREAMEYDFAITQYTTNQIIIRQRKNFRQLVIEGNYVISKLIAH